MALEEREKEKARERKARPGLPRSEKFAEQGEKGEALEKVARAVGWSRPTYEKARAVVEAARSDPESYGDLVGTMEEVSVLVPTGSGSDAGSWRVGRGGWPGGGWSGRGSQEEGAENILGEIFRRIRARP